MNIKKITLLVAATLSFPYISASAIDECSYRIVENIQYGTGLVLTKNGTSTIPLYLDAYLPVDCKNGSDKLPIPVGDIHGGGFVQGDKSSGIENKTNFAKAGYALFAINYRLLQSDSKPIIESLSDTKAQEFVTEFLEEGTPRDQTYAALAALEDAIKAKEFVAKEFMGKIDTHWFIKGGSAGAYTTINLAYLADYVFNKSENPLGIIEISGGIPNKKQYLSSGDANALIIHGTADTVVPYLMSDRLVSQASAANVPYQRITAPGSGHGLAGDGIYKWKVHETGLTIFEHMTNFIDTSFACKVTRTADCTNYQKELTTTDPTKENTATTTPRCIIPALTTLKRGDRLASKREYITILQQFLKDRGLFTPQANGVFGPQTQRAVMAYQRSKGVSPTGNLGPITLAKLKEEYCKK